MKLSINTIKRKALHQFDKAVKAATNRAIPIVKKETIQHISESSKNMEIVWNVAAGLALVIGVSASIKMGAITSGVSQNVSPISVTIETLNLYLGE